MRSGKSRLNTQQGTTTKGISCLTAVSTITPVASSGCSATIALQFASRLSSEHIEQMGSVVGSMLVLLSLTLLWLCSKWPADALVEVMLPSRKKLSTPVGLCPNQARYALNDSFLDFFSTFRSLPGSLPTLLRGSTTVECTPLNASAKETCPAPPAASMIPPRGKVGVFPPCSMSFSLVGPFTCLIIFATVAFLEAISDASDDASVEWSGTNRFMKGWPSGRDPHWIRSLSSNVDWSFFAPSSAAVGIISSSSSFCSWELVDSIKSKKSDTISPCFLFPIPPPWRLFLDSSAKSLYVPSASDDCFVLFCCCFCFCLFGGGAKYLLRTVWHCGESHFSSWQTSTFDMLFSEEVLAFGG